MPIIECIPNVSEGRRPEVIEAIAAAIRAVPGVRLLDSVRRRMIRFPLRGRMHVLHVVVLRQRRTARPVQHQLDAVPRRGQLVHPVVPHRPPDPS